MTKRIAYGCTNDCSMPSPPIALLIAPIDTSLGLEKATRQALRLADESHAPRPNAMMAKGVIKI